MSVIAVFDLPFIDPPLRSNDRVNRYAKARVVKSIRTAAWAVGKRWGRPTITGKVLVRLVWEVTTNHVRDVGASQPTLKAALDGLVDAGVLLRDDHRTVDEESCRIEVGGRKGVRIEVWAVEPTPEPSFAPPSSHGNGSVGEAGTNGHPGDSNGCTAI